MPEWNFSRNEKYDDDVRKLSRKHPTAVSGVLLNLATLKKVLGEVDDPAKVNCGFFKSEGNGLFRVSERGSGKNLAPIRIYVTFEIIDREIVLRRMLLKGTKKKQSEQITAIKKDMRTN